MKEIFNEILNSFENEDIKAFAEKVIGAAPKYFYEVPASSSFKYHPAYACTVPLGLAKHTVALLKFLNHMFNVETIGSQFNSRKRDLLRVAGIAHDMWKFGSQEEYEQNKATKFTHPLIAAKNVYKIDGVSQEEKKYCCMAIVSHMGQWNTDKRHPDEILPKPETNAQIILHLADYLASRKDIEVKFDSAVASESQPDIDTWRFPFGKYAGKTIPEVAKENRGYIIWAKNNMEMEPARTLLKDFNVEKVE